MLSGPPFAQAGTAPSIFAASPAPATSVPVAPVPDTSVSTAPVPGVPGSPVQAVPAPEVVIVQTEPRASAAASANFPPPPAAVAGQVRITLLLPRKSAAFRAAAETVQHGFMQACQREPDPRLNFKQVDTGDDPRDVLSAYQLAQTEADIVVGPLTRSGVTAIVAQGRVDKTTLALAHAETQADREATLPPRLLPIGLSVEDEARQMAQQLAAEHPGTRAWILAGHSAWQRRAARAFEMQWRQLRQLSDRMDLASSGNLLDINALQHLRRRLDTEQPGLVFAALDADQASQVREAAGMQLPMAGTSLLNPLPAGDWPVASRRPELDGVRLLDLPWLVQPDHPAVMAWRSTEAGPKRGAELERLYALGIDACRLARELVAGKSSFELDGVTGRLKVDMNAAQQRFSRQEVPAVYQDGAVVNAAGQ